jgi:hypothetical protein
MEFHIATFIIAKQTTGWRIELRGGSMDESATLVVDDASGAVSRAGRQLAGDRIAARIRWIHEGRHAG